MIIHCLILWQSLLGSSVINIWENSLVILRLQSAHPCGDSAFLTMETLQNSQPRLRTPAARSGVHVFGHPLALDGEHAQGRLKRQQRRCHVTDDVGAGRPRASWLMGGNEIPSKKRSPEFAGNG